MPDSKSPSAKNSLVTTRRACPLCESKSRREIDMLCASFQSPETDEDGAVNGEVVDYGTGEISDASDAGAIAAETLVELEADIREMLGKLRDDKTEFVTSDLIIHLTQHTLVQEFSGLQIRSEGNYLIVGGDVYEKKDLKTYLQFGIEKGVQAMAEGKMKWSLNGWTGMILALWRMQGTSGDDPFMKRLLESTQTSNINPESPLGAGYTQHHKTIANSKPPTESEVDEIEDSLKEE